MRIAVLGVGLIGGSIGLAARERVDGAEVTGFDTDPDALATARERGAIDSSARSVAEALAGAEACFVCVPVSLLPELCGEALGAAGEDCVVTDVGSTKRQLVSLCADERFVGGHPIAGTETAGVGHARGDLFEGAPWYLTPGERSAGVLYERAFRLVQALGAQPVAIDAETHDRVLAAVSHLPHVLANVLVAQAGRTLSEEAEALPRIGPSFRDATRVAGANSAIWADIYRSNAPAITAEIDAALARLQEARDLIAGGDLAAIASWNDSAREDRRRLHQDELAAGAPVHELHVTVPNVPGVLAQVALALGRARVNIVDMALAPAPDMKTGSIDLWVAGDEDAERSRELIAELGFPVASGRS
ncbi:MAG: prephenate dehydrogenase/arogenate dehydrogenase family protein [Thermoleophilaceae bacterium]|nr:prephenate dehydrogenase/arogenate dehydrogenase family protein [Thermoleophilaceae bacterium]